MAARSGWRGGGGAFSRDLVFLPVVFAGLAAGHLCFVASLLATDRQPVEAWHQLINIRSILRYLADDPNTLFRVFGVSFAEEVIYRVVAQPLLIDITHSTVAGLALAAAAFCVVHAHFFRNPWGQSVEFAVFAVLLGAVYWATGSLAAVVLIHAVRNWEIAYLEHVLAQQEQTDHGLPANAADAPMVITDGNIRLS